MLDSACILSGSVTARGGGGERVVAVMQDAADADASLPMPVDYAIGDRQDRWQFALAPGRYSLMAFHDLDGNLELDDDEPAHRVDDGEVFDCGGGEHIEDIRIEIDPDQRLKTDRVVSIGRGRGLIESALETAVSAGQMTAFGEVVDLDDPRFDPEVAGDSLWRPVDFILAGYSGVYLGKPFDSGRVPLLFIHGINGSPRVLEPLIRHFDSERYQPLYYYYPSGLRLDQVAAHLYRVMHELELRHDIDRMHVIAHSMGGLVAQAWLNERAVRGSPARIATFISISTPWLGYEAARQGVDRSPVVVPVWRDMASGSDFLADLFPDDARSGDNPAGQVRHHMLFSYQSEGWVSRRAGDGVASLASMLAPEVQRRAASLFGIDSGHVSILESVEAIEHIERILEQSLAEH